MKTLKFLVITASISFLLTSCFGDGNLICRRPQGETVLENYKTESFSSITLMMDAEVYISQGEEYKIEVEATDNIHEILVAKVSGKELTLKTENGKCIRGSSDVKFFITCPNLEGIDLAGSGFIMNESAFSGNSIDVKISGSGKIELSNLTYDQMFVSIAGSGELTMESIDAQVFESKTSGSGNTKVSNFVAQYVDIDIAGSGDINLSGSEVIELKGHISGSGKIQASDLPAKSVVLKIAGSGDAYVNAIDDLDVNIAGSGSVYYFGRPRIDSNVSGSGKIISQN